MCGRFTLISDLSEIVDTFDVSSVEYEYKPRYNIAPSQTIAVINGATENGCWKDIDGGLFHFGPKILR